MALIKVYYVKGVTLDGNGNPVVTELAKFFKPEHAQQHLETFGRTSRQSPYTSVGITITEEREEDQHPSHKGAWK